MTIDSEPNIKAPQEAILDLPQERITGDILRGRGPRRGNLERLIKYWRPIMRKPGGFRRCLVILADHPELYPLQRICAWLHHETTGLWPNEGNHHEGGKLGPIVGRARRHLKKPKKRKRRGKKSLDGSDFVIPEYGFKNMVSESRSFNGILVQPIAGRQNVLEAKAAMFVARLDEVSDRKEDIRIKRVGIVGSNSAAGQAIQAVGSILLPGDISDFRSPIRSQIYETLTPGGGGRRPRLRRVVRGGGARNKYRCPPGFQKGGTFTNKLYSTCGAQILGIPNFGPGAFTTGIERALARLARDANLVRSIGDLKNNSNPYDIIRAAQIPFAPKKGNPTRRQSSVDLVLARIANGERVPTRFVRRDGVILEPKVSFEELGKLDEFDDMVDGSLITKYNDGILGEGALGSFGTGIRDNYIVLEDQGVVKVSRVGGELDQGVRNNTVRAFNASVAKNSGRNPDRTAPLMDFIEASDGKFSVEFGEIKNNAFIPDNTAKNELVQVRSGNIIKFVPKWVYDTFLSRTAPRRLDSDPVYEMIDSEEKSLSPFFNARERNKEDASLAHAYFNTVNKKAAKFSSLVHQAELEIKAPRLGRRAGRGAARGIRGTASALFDNALGRWRCPPGTRRGGTFSDRLGSNCGYSLPATLVNNLGKATNAIRNIKKTDRKRQKTTNNVSKKLGKLNESLEEVLNITESRAGTRLGRTIGQRRAIGSLDATQERLFSGEGVRAELRTISDEIDDILENGDRGEVAEVWDQLSKLANLEAGRITDNTSTDRIVEQSAREIQDMLDRWAQKIIDRPQAEEGFDRRSSRVGIPAGVRDPEKRREYLRARRDEKIEKISRLSRNLLRNRRMRRTGDTIPEITSAAFYNEDGTVNESFLSARRSDAAAAGIRAKHNLAALLNIPRSRRDDDDFVDAAAVEFLENNQPTVDSSSQELGNHARIISELNTFREMRALVADDDTRFAKQFEDALRRINAGDRNELLDKIGIRPDRDSAFDPQVDEATLRNLDDNPLGLETRFARTGITTRIRDSIANRRKALRERINAATWRNYVEGETVNSTLRNTLLNNPNLPPSVAAVAGIPWTDHARLLSLRNKQKLDLYKNYSQALTPEERADLYKSTGIAIMPESMWNHTDKASAGEVFDSIISRTNAKEDGETFIKNAMGAVVSVDSDGNPVDMAGIRVGDPIQLVDDNGNAFEAIREIAFVPEDGDIFTNPDGKRIKVASNLVFRIRRTDTDEVIYERRNRGSWDEGHLEFTIDFSDGSANFGAAGTNHSTQAIGWVDGYDHLNNESIEFAGGGYFNKLVERATPFLVGSRVNDIAIGSTAYTGMATWIRYGFTNPQDDITVRRMQAPLDAVINDAEEALRDAADGRPISRNGMAALTIIGTPEKLEEIKILRNALDPNEPELSPDAYTLYSVMAGVDSNGNLNRSSALYRAMTAGDTNRREGDVNKVQEEVESAAAAFGVTPPQRAAEPIDDLEEWGQIRGLNYLASSDLKLDLSDLTVAIESPEIAEQMDEEFVSITRRLSPDRPRDAYGVDIGDIDKRHAALMTEEERGRGAAEIERSLNKLVRDGILSEEDEEVSNLVNLAAELRNASDFPEETRGADDPLDEIAVDLGSTATIQALIDDLDFLIEESDTPADLENLRSVLQDALDSPTGRSTSKVVSNPDKEAKPNFFSRLSRNFKGRRYRKNLYTDDESDKNAQIAGQLTIFDELDSQVDARNEVARRGVDAIMEEVVEVAARNGMSPEEVVERATAHALRDSDFDPTVPLPAGDTPRSGPPSEPVAQITFNQGRIQDMRLMNMTLKTLLTGQANRGDGEGFDIFNEPTILEDGTLVARTNPDGSLITREQARNMLKAVVAFDERVEEAYNFFEDRSTPVPLVLAETEEELDQLINAFSLTSNVPGDDYLMLRLGNMVGIFEEAKARRGRPEGQNMLTTGALGGRREITTGDVPSKRDVTKWVESSGFQVNPELDERIYKMRTEDGLSIDEVAERLNMDRFEVRVREAEHRNTLSEARRAADRVTQGDAVNLRRVDAYDADREESESVIGELDDNNVPPTGDVPQAGLPEDFDLGELIRRPVDVPDTLIPSIDDEDTGVERIVERPRRTESLDDLLTSIEQRADSLEAALNRIAARDGVRGAGYGGGRSRGALPTSREQYDNMPIDELLEVLQPEYISPFGGAYSDRERALSALRRRSRDMTDEELLELDRKLRNLLAFSSVGRDNSKLERAARIVDEQKSRRNLESGSNVSPRLQELFDNMTIDPTPERPMRLVDAPPTGDVPRAPTPDEVTPDADDLDFQRRVWALRTEAGLSVEEAAEVLGVDRGDVRRAEVNYGRSLSRPNFDADNVRARQRARGSNREMREGTRASEVEERLWDLRTRQGYTLDEAAEELGLDRVEARNMEISHARKLTPEQRERDYERGRVAATIRSGLDVDDTPPPVGDAPRSGPPPQRAVAQVRSDGTVEVVPEPLEDNPQDIFDRLIADPVYRFADGDSERRRQEFDAFFSELENMSPSRRENNLRGVDPDSDIYRPWFREELIETDEGTTIEDLRERFNQPNLTEEYVRFLRSTEGARARLELDRETAVDAEGVDNMTETLEEAVEEATPRASRFQRLKDRIVAKFSPRTSRSGEKDPETGKSQRRWTQVVSAKGKLPSAIMDIGQKNDDGSYSQRGIRWRFFDSDKQLYATGDSARALATGQFADHSRVDLVSDASIEEMVDIMGFAPEVGPDGSFRALPNRPNAGSLVLKRDNQGNEYLQYTPENYLTGGRGTVINMAPMRKELPDGTLTTTGATIEDDMIRRDLTVNALAANLLPEGVEKARGAGQGGGKEAIPQFIDVTGALNDLGLELNSKGEIRLRRVDAETGEGAVVFGAEGPLVRPYVPGDLSTQTSVMTEPEMAESVIRSVGDPKERLTQDPLRALRALRRLATGNNDGRASMDPDLGEAIREVDMSEVDPLRIASELQRAMATVPSTRRFFDLLDEYGLMEKMFPEITPNRENLRKVRSIDRNEPVLLAALLDGNPPEAIDAVLDRLGYAEPTKDAVRTLLELKDAKVDEDNILDTIDKFKKLTSGSRSLVSTTDMFSFGPMSGLDAPTVAALIKMANDPDGVYANLDERGAVEILESLKASFDGMDYVKNPANLGNVIERAVRQGGGTINLVNKTDVTSGWAIARNGQGIVVPTEQLINPVTGEPRPEAVRRVFAMIRQNIGEDVEGGEIVFGMWREKRKDRVKNPDGSLKPLTGDEDKDYVENDVVHFDIVDVYPKDEMSLEDAKEAGRRQSQKKIADLDNIDSGNWGDAFPEIDQTNEPDLLNEATQTNRDALTEFDNYVAESQRAAEKTNPISLPDMIGVATDEQIKSELADLLDPETNIVLPGAKKDDQGKDSYKIDLDNYLEILEKNFQKQQDNNVANRADIIEHIKGLRSDLNVGADVTPDVVEEEAVTPPVVKPVLRSLDADALEGDALRAELDSIIEEVVEANGEIAVNISDIRNAAEKAQEGSGGAAVNRILDKISPRADFDNRQQRIAFLEEVFADAKSQITIKVTPLTEQVDDVVDEE